MAAPAPSRLGKVRGLGEQWARKLPVSPAQFIQLPCGPWESNWHLHRGTHGAATGVVCTAFWRDRMALMAGTPGGAPRVPGFPTTPSRAQGSGKGHSGRGQPSRSHVVTMGSHTRDQPSRRCTQQALHPASPLTWRSLHLFPPWLLLPKVVFSNLQLLGMTL